MKKLILFLTAVLTLNLQLLTLNCTAQYTKLLDFTGATNGSYPYGSLISDGTFLYGMTKEGGTNALGVIFKIKPNGTGYAKLFDFDSINGSHPYGSLISVGTFLYGMTYSGGSNDIGVIFKIKPDGTGYLKLFDFTFGNNAGNGAAGNLISDGIYLYGMTRNGGFGINGDGDIFKIKLDGTGYTILLDFNGVNGSRPAGSLFFDGTFLYGMAAEGGTGTCALGCGVVFKIKPDGTGYVNLHNFVSTGDGRNPSGSLISDGTFLYGMTSYGYGNGGTIFKIKPDGTGYADIHDFTSSDGSVPIGSLISDGTFLYGMTSSGGTNSYGIIFKIKPNGTGYSKLMDFDGAKGAQPQGDLISDGTSLFGMTLTGGYNSNQVGTVFKYCLTPITFTQTLTLCAGQSVHVGTYNYTNSGTYITPLHSYQGCDSTVTTHLTINDISVSVSTPTLTANASPATYQWIDCGNGNLPIVGEINQSFTANPSDNGNYAVIVTHNSCSDTSSCYNITNIGIVENSFVAGINISPNPFTFQTNILFNEAQKNSTIKIMDILGKEIKSINFKGKQLTIEKGEMKEGIYFVQVIDENKNVVNKKIVMQ